MALSRCRTLEGLKIIDYNLSKIQADKKVAEFYRRMVTAEPTHSNGGKVIVPLEQYLRSDDDHTTLFALQAKRTRGTFIALPTRRTPRTFLKSSVYPIPDAPVPVLVAPDKASPAKILLQEQPTSSAPASESASSEPAVKPNEEGEMDEDDPAWLIKLANAVKLYKQDNESNTLIRQSALRTLAFDLALRGEKIDFRSGRAPRARRVLGALDDRLDTGLDFLHSIAPDRRMRHPHPHLFRSWASDSFM